MFCWFYTSLWLLCTLQTKWSPKQILTICINEYAQLSVPVQQTFKKNRRVLQIEFKPILFSSFDAPS